MQTLLKGGMDRALSRYSDILLAVVVVGIVGMLIIPLPTFVLDLLLVVNFTIGVGLLMLSLYIPSAIKISSFPSILLITTLFRLALNISSTRLILLYADAGDVITSFGNFVVRGNYVVGGVIFMILTLVQFLVVAKGAERVSEVGARFTLDAMPGKQMSIDADLRAGAFDLDEARRRRGLVQMESKLYGSLDGAMKFVKGDAIAGLIITAINIIAGIIIGVVQKDMAAGEAAMKYTLLTIGDGLVSQIPALLIATTAGIIVTRVANEDEPNHLGHDLFGQIFAQPKAIAITSVLLVCLGLIPGLPFIPFVLVAIVVGVVAYGLYMSQQAPEAQLTETEQAEVTQVEDQAKEGARQARAMIPAVMPLALDVGPALSRALEASGRGEWLQEMIPTMREGVFYELGVKVPGLRVRMAGGCGDQEFIISIDEVPTYHGKYPAGKILVNESPEGLKVFEIEAQPTRHPTTRKHASWVAVEHRQALEEAGYSSWDEASYILLALTAALRQRARDFLGLQDVQAMLDQLEGPYPAAVQEVVPKLIGLQDLADIMRRLADEGISLRQLPRILQILAERAKVIKDPIALTEEVRAGLCRYITHKYAGTEGQLVVYLVDREIEETIASAVRITETGSYLALPPDVTGEIMQAVGREVRADVAAGRNPILLTDQRARRYLKRLVSLEFPDAVVLSYQEVDPALKVQPLGRIAVGTRR